MSKPSSTDAFAAIGARQANPQVAQLQELTPSTAPLPTIPVEPHRPELAFTPRPPVQSSETLAPILQNLREAADRFAVNLAPPSQDYWQRQKLTQFDWRIARTEDWQDFPAVLAGAGPWEQVTIPHYGEPVGPASTFYRTRFELSEEELSDRSLFLHFRGVDYQAHVFLNGNFLGSHEGFFAPFEFSASHCARVGENTLTVRVDNDFTCLGESQHHESPSIDGDKIYAATNQGYDEPLSGWHHCPPGMGIYQDVWIESRPTLHLTDLFIRPLSSLDRAEAWIEVNHSQVDPTPVPIELSLSIFGQNFELSLLDGHPCGDELVAGPGKNYYRFEFDVPNARLWTPEEPWLYQAQVTLRHKNEVCDQRARQFGMRTFVFDEASTPKGEPILNGQRIRLRGANTMGHEQQCVMRGDFEQLREDLLLAKAANLNFLRFTQRPVQEEIYDLCDQLGLMAQTDLPLFAHLRRHQFAEAVRQAQEMERLVRAHPCNIYVSYINEPFPAEWKPMAHRRLHREELERFFRAASEAIHVVNPDRAIKPVDGDYDPPAPGLPDNHCYTYWYLGHGIDAGKLHRGFWQAIKPGWQYGCGEFGAEGLDSREVLEEFCPTEWLPAPGSDEAEWSPSVISKAQLGKFHLMFFDRPQTLDGWISASRTHQAHAMRRMTEAFRRDSRNVSCAIHLFIDAWPTGWMKTIVDVQRQPKPAYFAYREALTPLMANIRTDRERFTSGDEMSFEFWLCHDRGPRPEKATLRWQLEVAGAVLHAQESSAEVPDVSATCQGKWTFPAPEVDQRTPATLRLSLWAGGELLHDTSLELELFPVAKPITTPVEVFGQSEGPARRLLHDQGLPLDASADLLLIDDLAAYEKSADSIDQRIAAGARAVFLDLPVGEHRLAGKNVKIEAVSMHPRFFVSRQTGHPLIEAFEPHDFNWWYDPDLDRAAPLLETTCWAEDARPILITSASHWGEEVLEPDWAAAEWSHGQGSIVVCQLKFANRTRHNPPAQLWFQRLANHNLASTKPAVTTSSPTH